ncbi:MAG: hypothetical protein ABIS03_04100 [Gemmatimonadaceae bacterium]
MKAPPAGPALELGLIQALEHKYAELQQEHDFQKKKKAIRHYAQVCVTALCRRNLVTTAGFYAWIASRAGQTRSVARRECPVIPLPVYR